MRQDQFPRPALREGTDVVLVHGMWSHPGVWDEVLGELEQRGLPRERVLVPALRHHAELPRDAPPEGLATTSVADYVDDLAALLARHGGRRFVLVGHSLGGLLVQLLAPRVAASALVLVAPAPRGQWLAIAPAPVRSLAFALLHPRFFARAHRPTFAQAARGILADLPDDAQQALHRGLRFESGRALAEVAFGFTGWSKAAHVAPAPPIPTRVLCGTRDRVCPLSVSDRTARALGTQVEPIADAGHWLLSSPHAARIATAILEAIRATS